MKRASKRKAEAEMLPEYDFSNAVRGKYYGRAVKGARVSVTAARRAPAKAVRRNRLAAGKVR